jgi:NAD(P)-dependent dehydrogenase (short-subunit alcohol dehydrogenase family)
VKSKGKIQYHQFPGKEPSSEATVEYIERLFHLRNRVAVFTGGSGVLAREIAHGFLKAGARVVLLGTNAARLDDALRDLAPPSGRALGIVCDVLDESRLRQVHRQVLEEFSAINVLINAAGGNTPGGTLRPEQSVFELDIGEFRQVADLNFLGTVLPTLVFGKSMAEKGSGSIINISSMAARRVISRVAGYSAAKAAVENFTRWMAVEMAEKFGSGIRVNAIAPGFFLTEQNRTLLTNPDGSLTERGQSIVRMTPFKRFGEPSELVGTALWLASDASRFVTGAVIPVDGGFSVQSGV